MHIVIAGSGNTASATLFQLLATNTDCEISIVARDENKMQAAILDAASAYPQSARRARGGTKKDMRSCDVLLLCAGAQMELNDTPKSLLEKNTRIARDYLADGLAAKTRIVVIGTPVDDLTAIIGESGICGRNHIIGFGGDLDTSRLHYALALRNKPVEHAVCVGEHGGRTIPVYQGEEDYPDVRDQVRTLLKTITAKAGPPRNLATGRWLSQLGLALTRKTPEERVVCGYMEEYGLNLTWPRKVSADGLGAANAVQQGPCAQRELETLLEKKRKELPELKALAKKLFS